MKVIATAVTLLLICLPAFAEPQLSSADKGEIDRLTRAIKIEPTADAYGQRGLVYDKNGMFQQAESDFTEAMKLAPKEGRFLWLRGMALAEQNKFQEALADCTETLKISEKGDDDYTQALRIRSHCFEKLHREQDMLADLKQLSALGDSTAAAAVARWENDHKGGIQGQLEAKQIPRSIVQWNDATAAPWPGIEKIAAAMDEDEPRLGQIHMRASVALILIREYPEALKKFRDDPINMAMNPSNGPELLAAYLGHVSRCLEQGKKPIFLKSVYWEQIEKLWKEGKRNDALALSYHPELGKAQIEGVNRYMDQIKGDKSN